MRIKNVVTMRMTLDRLINYLNIHEDEYIDDEYVGSVYEDVRSYLHSLKEKHSDAVNWRSYSFLLLYIRLKNIPQDDIRLDFTDLLLSVDAETILDNLEAEERMASRRDRFNLNNEIVNWEEILILIEWLRNPSHDQTILVNYEGVMGAGYRPSSMNGYMKQITADLERISL